MKCATSVRPRFLIITGLAGKCGIFVCLDCYQFRLGGLVKDQAPAESSFMDEYNWPLCITNEEHKIEELLLAQIIPKTGLLDLGHKLHEKRDKWGLSQHCHAPPDFEMVFQRRQSPSIIGKLTTNFIKIYY